MSAQRELLDIQLLSLMLRVESEIVRVVCLLIQDLQCCSWRLEKSGSKDSQFDTVNIDTLGCFITSGA